MEDHTFYFELGPYCSFIADECTDDFCGFAFNVGYSKITSNFQIILQFGGLAMGLVFGSDEE